MIGQIQKEAGMTMPVEDFVEKYHFGLVEVVFEWARGMVNILHKKPVLWIYYLYNLF